MYQTTPWPAVAPKSEISTRFRFGHSVNASFSGLADVMPAALDVLEDRRLLHPQADVERDADQDDRDEERDAPAPRAKVRRAHRVLHDQDHDERAEQAERRGDLDEARVEAAPVVRHVLGDVDRRAAVLAAERQPLEDADEQERDRRRQADRRVVGSTPTSAVAPPMITSVTRNAYLRPTRSPMRPKNSAPNGRTTNPTANVERYAMSASVSLPLG